MSHFSPLLRRSDRSQPVQSLQRSTTSRALTRHTSSRHFSASFQGSEARERNGSKIRDAVGWAERITQTQSLVAEWHDAARQVIQASKSGDIPLREIRRLRDQAASLLVLIPTAQRDPSLAQAAEAAYQGNRQRIILARCVSAAMVAAAVLVPGVLITFFMMWIFS